MQQVGLLLNPNVLQSASLLYSNQNSLLQTQVANMFFLPTGMLHGAEVTWQMIFMNNLLPVTIGMSVCVCERECV